MNRPSLYGAFGDKRELFIKSYQRYREDARAAMADIFRDELPIRKRLERIYAVALDIYLSGESGPRGCFTVMTAASEAVSDPDIRAMVLEGFAELDKAFAACFRRAKEKGELPASADPVVLAQLASATIHTIAIRARARMPRKELEAIVNGALDVMLGADEVVAEVRSLCRRAYVRRAQRRALSSEATGQRRRRPASAAPKTS